MPHAAADGGIVGGVRAERVLMQCGSRWEGDRGKASLRLVRARRPLWEAGLVVSGTGEQERAARATP